MWDTFLNCSGIVILEVDVGKTYVRILKHMEIH